MYDRVHVDKQEKKPPAAEGEISSAMPAVGGNSATLERLAQVANDMTHLEWKLLKSKAKAAAAGGDALSTSE